MACKRPPRFKTLAMTTGLLCLLGHKGIKGWQSWASLVWFTIAAGGVMNAIAPWPVHVIASP